MNIAAISFVSGLAVLFPITVGALLSDKSGYLNIGLEGYLNLGAFLYFLLRAHMLSVPAFLLSLIILVSFALFFEYYSMIFAVNHYITGLVINLLVQGLIPIISELTFATKGSIFKAETASRYIVQFMSAKSTYGGLRMTEIVALGSGVLGLVYLSTTTHGIRIAVMGNNAKALELAGVNTRAMRLEATAVTAMLAACSGVAMIGSLGAWIPNMASGRGWIALVLVYLGQRSEMGVVVSCVLFIVFQVLTMDFQKYSMLMTEFLMAAPYLVISIFIVLYSISKKS